MTEQRTLNDAITDLIKSHIQEQPTPTPCTITETHNDGTVTIQTKQYGKLTHTPTITTHNIGDKSVLLFLNGNYNERIII